MGFLFLNKHMANPQKENGFTPIANELLEQIIASGLNGNEMAVTFFIIRKTYGFQKKQDEILEAHNKCLTVTKTKIASAETDIRWLKNYQKLLFSVILGLGGSIGGLIILWHLNR